MASLAHLAIWCGYALVKDGVALNLERTCDDQSRLSSLPWAKFRTSHRSLSTRQN
jgi:hypothetical protein